MRPGRESIGFLWLMASPRPSARATQALPTVQTLTAELNTTNDFGAFVRAVRREFRGLYA